MRAASTRRLIWLARRLSSLLLSATLFAWLPRALAAAPSPAPPVPPAPQRVMELLLQVDVNQQRLDEPVLVLRREDGTLLIAGEDLDRWRLRRPSTRGAGCGSIRPTRSITPPSSLAFASATRSPGRARGGARCVSAARSMAPTSAPSRDSFVPRSCRPPGRPCSRPPSTSS